MSTVQIIKNIMTCNYRFSKLGSFPWDSKASVGRYTRVVSKVRSDFILLVEIVISFNCKHGHL